jgi:hypothetical protein
MFREEFFPKQNWPKPDDDGGCFGQPNPKGPVVWDPGPSPTDYPDWQGQPGVLTANGLGGDGMLHTGISLSEILSNNPLIQGRIEKTEGDHPILGKIGEIIGAIGHVVGSVVASAATAVATAAVSKGLSSPTTSSATPITFDRTTPYNPNFYGSQQSLLQTKMLPTEATPRRKAAQSRYERALQQAQRPAPSTGELGHPSRLPFSTTPPSWMQQPTDTTSLRDLNGSSQMEPLSIPAPDHRSISEQLNAALSPLIQGWIPAPDYSAGLIDAVRPMSSAQAEQLQAQTEQQNRITQQQLRLMQAEQDRAEAQTQALQRQAAALKKPMKIRDPEAGGDQMDLIRKLANGDDLSDQQTKQLFHQLDLEKYSAKTKSDKFNEIARRGYAIEKLVKNRVAQLAQTADEDGLINFQGAPISTEDLSYWVRQDIEHFERTDQHLSPSQVLAESGAVALQASQNLSKHLQTVNPSPQNRPIMNIPGLKHYKFPRNPHLPLKTYPDITKNVQLYEEAIKKTILKERGSYIKIDPNNFVAQIQAAQRFSPNHIWDLKGQPGLPNAGEWALYQGRPVDYQYIANHAFGFSLPYLGLNLDSGLEKAETILKKLGGHFKNGYC